MEFIFLSIVICFVCISNKYKLVDIENITQSLNSLTEVKVKDNMELKRENGIFMYYVNLVKEGKI